MMSHTSLPSVSSREIMCALGRDGFTRRPSKGHLVMCGHGRTVAIPNGKSEVRRSTLRTILQQAGLTADEFVKLLK